MGPIELLLTCHSTDLLSEVIYGCPAPIDDALIESLGHTVTGLRRDWIPWTIYCQQTWYAGLE